MKLKYASFAVWIMLVTLLLTSCAGSASIDDDSLNVDLSDADSIYVVWTPETVPYEYTLTSAENPELFNQFVERFSGEYVLFMSNYPQDNNGESNFIVFYADGEILYEMMVGAFESTDSAFVYNWSAYTPRRVGDVQRGIMWLDGAVRRQKQPV